MQCTLEIRELTYGGAHAVLHDLRHRTEDVEYKVNYSVTGTCASVLREKTESRGKIRFEDIDANVALSILEELMTLRYDYLRVFIEFEDVRTDEIDSSVMNAAAELKRDGWSYGII